MVTPYYADEHVTLYPGDCLDVLADLPDVSVDAVVCDPPYDLTAVSRGGSARVPGTGPYGRHTLDTKQTGFMGKAWDGTGVAFRPELWEQCLRVLKPGGHLLAFGGTRTYHRLTCAIEDAGFEIRDSITWIYASGFPKSLDVSKALDRAAGAEREVIGTRTDGWSAGDGSGVGNMHGRDVVNGSAADTRLLTLTAPATDDAKRWDGWGTALKPAQEPIVVARKPLAGTVAANVVRYGTGALNVDGCRVAHASAADLAVSQAKNPGRADLVTSSTYGADRPQQSVNDAGRWPTNLVFSHSPDCADVCAQDCPVAELDRQSGTSQPRQSGWSSSGSRESLNGSMSGKNYARDPKPDDFMDRGGGASRFFPVFRYEPKAPTRERPRADGIAHPTVKPLDLMRWLVRLVTPPGGTCLDPFAGSGTTAEACIVEGFRCITIEQHAEYLPLIVARLSKPLQPVLRLEVP